MCFLFCFVVIFAVIVYRPCQLKLWDIVFQFHFPKSPKSHSTFVGSSGHDMLNCTFDDAVWLIASTLIKYAVSSVWFQNGVLSVERYFFSNQ